eukprot:m.8448 g.8448  ORF g.8448 m.8448 type:complete len:100 (+) comp6974_c0_seq1:822-1121(+)
MPESTWGKFLVGYGVTLTAGLLAYPLDTIRVIMVLTGWSMTETVRFVLEKDGWAGFFRGAFLTVSRGVIGGLALCGLDMVQSFFRDARKRRQSPQQAPS